MYTLKSVCTHFNSLLKEHGSKIERLFLKKRNGRLCMYSCHNESYFKRAYNALLIHTHECDVTCNTPCHRNNDFNEFGLCHWDITTFSTQPYKCTFCGKVYIDKYTAMSVFHVCFNELKSLNGYIHAFELKKKLYRLRDVRWLALHVNGTIHPMYRYSVTRVKREEWLHTHLHKLLSSDKAYDFMSVEALSQTTMFQNFLSKPFPLKHLMSLIYKLRTILPKFVDLYTEMEELRKRLLPETQEPFFPNMNNKPVWIEHYGRTYRDSIEYSIGIALLGNVSTINTQLVQMATEDVRQKVFRIYSHNKRINSILSPMSMQHYLYTNFIQGSMNLEEVINEFNLQNECSDRKLFINEWLRSKGVFASVIKCDTLTRYVNKGDINKNMVWKCMKAHIFYSSSFDCILKSTTEL